MKGSVDLAPMQSWSTAEVDLASGGRPTRGTHRLRLLPPPAASPPHVRLQPRGTRRGSRRLESSASSTWRQ
jgi:hypothetical protein